MPNLTVAENLFLGHQPTKWGFVRKAAIADQARRVLATYGVDIDVKAELGSYSVAVQQIVAIARAVELSGKMPVLDEPTASLDRNEVERLFDVTRSFKARGLAILFITHFLDQVFAISDRVTILRNGKLVKSQPLSNLSRTDVVRMMLGKDIVFGQPATLPEETETGPILVSFKGMGKAG